MTPAGPDDAATGPRADIPQLREASDRLRQGQTEAAEIILRRYLDENPADANALLLLAEVAIRCNSREDAEQILERCLEIAPDFRAARYRHAQILYEQNKGRRALPEIEALLRDAPGSFECLSLKAVVLGQTGEFVQALSCHEQLVRDHPERPGLWLNYASDLRAAGRQRESIAMYRSAIERFPRLAEAYWSLGNFKTFRFEPADIAAMESELSRPDLADRNRCLLHYALGKAFEDAHDFERSFGHYGKANALRRRAVHHDADAVTRSFERLKATFSARFLADREGAGCPVPDPIFIVGLPRSGSTLLAQILSSHSAIETLGELTNINAAVDRLDGPYPEALSELDPAAFGALGEEFIEETRELRGPDRPFFVDKMPDNFRHVGFIHAVLPNAKIIDMRRDPMACGFSNFKQDFEVGYTFTNDLADFARYYCDYVGLMDHFDRALPGRVYRVRYERLIENPEFEVRNLLEHISLPFEENCLRFHENVASIRTASSEQVRTPLFRDAVAQWRNYEQWLEPLKLALGPDRRGF